MTTGVDQTEIRKGLRLAVLAGVVALLAAAPLALADPEPGELDKSFADDGIFRLAAGDRYEAVGSPLVQPSGRIVFAGLLKNSSDRVFLGATTTAGAIDTGFGDAGEVHTNSVAPQRMAATAMTTDGRIFVAGGSNSDGKFTVERFTVDGVKDGTWSSSGLVKADLDTAYARPTAIIAKGTASAFVALEAPSGGRDVFTVVKMTAEGLDSSFGDQGVARVPFSGNRAATVRDLALVDGGKIVLAGSVGAVDGTAKDTALARLNPDGSLDTSFGTDGTVTHNVAGGSTDDYAKALAILANGRIVVTGPANGVGMVARTTGDGALDPSFGSQGKVLGGMMKDGEGFVPVDLVADASGRLLVAGSDLYGSKPYTKWAVAQLTPNASPVLDNGFGSKGRFVTDKCKNTIGAGPSGMAMSGAKILLLGGCENTDRVAMMRLLGGSAEPVGPITLSVTPSSGAAGHERIPLAGLDPSAALDSDVDAQAAALRRTALRRTALRRTDIASTALRRTALRRTGLFATALRRTALRRTLLSEIALRRTSWQELLGTDVPLQTLTLEDAYEINPDGVGALTLDDIDLNSTALRRTSMAALILGARALDSLPAPSGGWCDFLASQPYNCGNGADPAVSSLLEVELLGDDLSEYYETPISLRDTQLGSGETAAPLAGFKLSELELKVQPFHGASASEFASILNCGTCSGKKLSDLSSAELGDATVGALVGLLPKPSLADVSVGDVVLAMLDRSEIPYESLDLDGLLGEAEFRDQQLNTYTADFSLDCAQAPNLRVVFDTPNDARPVPGGVTASLNGGPKRDLGKGEPAPGTKRGPFSFELAPACAGTTAIQTVELELVTEPGSVLGPIDGAAVSVRGGGFSRASNELTTRVDDSRDPGDEIETARPISDDALLTGHLASASDADSFSFTPGAGRTTISLSHLPADYDLVIYGPAVGPAATALRRTALRRTALRRTPLDDAGESPIDEAVTAPDQVQDIALRRTDLSVRATSINRGEGDEAASVVVGPDEAGATFTAQVVGYNGASDADPYVIRRSDAPSVEALPCPARPLSSSLQIPFPNQIPNSTKAIYLVDPGRMAARDGSVATQNALDKLAELATATDGVVVPVQNDPRVPTSEAFTAWDADPCSPEKANAVVTAINEVVDDVRSEGGGLPELRSVVIVGPDEVMPQARIVDRTAIGNESDYADDVALDRNGDGAPDDNAVSAALRLGFMLSDDPYGDFDPRESGYVPDVALGRLVETPGQIRTQAQAFLDADGIVEPERAFVTGYDFLSDGASETFDALSGAVADGKAQSRIDETWTAADGLAGLNAPGAAFLDLNGHYDHYRALPAAAFNGTNPDLLAESEAMPPAGSLAFTVGCHSGLNMAVGDATSLTDPRLGDWVQRMATNSIPYAANTGFGYGDDTAVAYSERIMTDYARGLVSGDVTSGQALMLAKQAAYASTGVSDVYWMKSSMEATYYGLPMYRLGQNGGEGASVLPPQSIGASATPTTRSSEPLKFDLRDRLRRVDDPERGSFWQVDDEDPLVIQRQPIQPKLTRDLSSDGDAPAHGYLIDSLLTSEVSVSDHAVGRATIDLADHEPEPETTDQFFPATMASVEAKATADGRTDSLTLMAGSFRGDRQRLNLEVGGRVLRSASSDFSPPTIKRVDGLVADGAFAIRVEAEGNDLLGGIVLYLTDADEAAGGELQWHRSELSVIAPGVLSTGGTLPSGSLISEASVQVYDDSYNIATSNKKVDGFTFSPLKEPGTGDPIVRFDPAPPASGYYLDPPQISLNKGAHDQATFEVSVDGGAYRPEDGPFRVNEPAEGEHLVTYRGSDGSVAAARFAVDRGGPTIVAEADRAANSNGWYDGPVTISFECADAVSGVASCPEPVTLSDAGANQSVSGTATDRAGHSSDVTVDGINIDPVAPTITAELLEEPNAYGWYNGEGVTVRFDCRDGLSGLAVCGNRQLSGAPSKSVDEVTISSEGRDQVKSGLATDLAGHSTIAVSPPVSIDRTNPTVAITTTSGSILVGNQKVNGTASDALSGVRAVQVTYTNSLGQTVQQQADSINCDAAGACTWSAPPPSIGIWNATARSTDFAGNQSPPSGTTVITVR